MRALAVARGSGRKADAMRRVGWSVVLWLGAGLVGLAGLAWGRNRRGPGTHGPLEEPGPVRGASRSSGGPAGARPRPRAPTARPEAPTGPGAPRLLIVAQDQPALCRALLQAFGGSPQLRVLRDGRWANRRRQARAVPVDRRRRERRSPPRIEEDLQLRPYLLVRPPAHRPQDWRLPPDR